MWLLLTIYYLNKLNSVKSELKSELKSLTGLIKKAQDNIQQH